MIICHYVLVTIFHCLNHFSVLISAVILFLVIVNPLAQYDNFDPIRI